MKVYCVRLANSHGFQVAQVWLYCPIWTTGK
jgi:hypothetical protein